MAGKRSQRLYKRLEHRSSSLKGNKGNRRWERMFCSRKRSAITAEGWEPDCEGFPPDGHWDVASVETHQGSEELCAARLQSLPALMQRWEGVGTVVCREGGGKRLNHPLVLFLLPD